MFVVSYLLRINAGNIGDTDEYKMNCNFSTNNNFDKLVYLFIS
jgi:hypothetical protein